MKHAIRVLRRKQEKRVRHPGGTSVAKAGSLLPKWTIASLIVILTAVSTFALCEYVIFCKIPPLLLGKWEVTHGELLGMRMEFYRDGTLVGQIHPNTRPYRSRVRVENDVLQTTLLDLHTGAEEPVIRPIVSLTENELVIEEVDGTEVRLERVRH